MDAEQILAFRLARSGLAARSARDLAEAAACPASDFVRDAALLALGARAERVTREDYHRAIDAGDLVLAHIMRGAIHVLAPEGFGLYGRALVATDDAELGAQLGQQVQRLTAEHRIAPTAALDEVAAATADALADGRALDKNALHEELRQRVRAELMPWCKGCKSFHVAPMLWRFGTVKAGVRIDAERRYRLAEVDGAADPRAAARRYLHFYGPGTPGEFGDWAGLARPQAKRIWDGIADELEPVGKAWILRADAGALDSPPAATGVRLIPPGDPYLQKPNRPLLAPDKELRSRLFRPVASPGAVLRDGRLAGLWRAKAKGKKTEITVEPLGRLARGAVTEEAARVADLRGSAGVAVVMA